MERRKFLGKLFKGTAASFLPVSVLAQLVIPATPATIVSPGIIFDHVNREIRLNAPYDNTGITIQQLHHFAREEWETNEQLINVKYPFKIIDTSMYLEDGFKISPYEL